MIYDTLENIDQYTGMFEHLDTAIDWLHTYNLDDLPLGETVISDNGIRVVILQQDTKPAESLYFETHSDYLHLHIPLSGESLFEVAYGQVQAQPSKEEKEDCSFWQAQTSGGFVLSEGRFALFMVEEAHKPFIRAAGSQQVRTAVFYIPYE